MHAGARYQNQVTAWLAVKMLAERPAALIVPRGKLTYIAAESGEAVDDALAGNDQGAFAFVQAKGAPQNNIYHMRRKNGLLGIRIHHLKDQSGQSSFWPGATPSVPWGVEFPIYDWDKDLDRFRKTIEAAGKRADAARAAK